MQLFCFLFATWLWSPILRRFILELGQQFWYHLTMLGSGTSEQKTLTRGILARKRMSELSIQKRLTKPSCPFQTTPSFVVHLANCRSIDHCPFTSNILHSPLIGVTWFSQYIFFLSGQKIFLSQYQSQVTDQSYSSCCWWLSLHSSPFLVDLPLW